MNHRDPADDPDRPDSVAAPAPPAHATAPDRPIPAPDRPIPATAPDRSAPDHLVLATASDRPAPDPDRPIPATAPDRSVPADVPDRAGVAGVRERLDSVAAPDQPVAAAVPAGGRDSGEGHPPLAVAVHWADTYADSPGRSSSLGILTVSRAHRHSDSGRPGAYRIAE